MNMNIKTERLDQIISVREHPVLYDLAVDYFASKWGVDRKIFEASISDSLNTQNPLPRWYLMIKFDDIIDSFGEARRLGFDKLYLCTDHIGYYEK